MTDTLSQAPKLLESTLRVKLSRMLRSIARRFPNTYLITTPAAFGVRLADGSYLHIVTNGSWTDDNMRDFLALFVVWLAADPDRLRPGTVRLDGVLQEETPRREL